MVDIKRGKQLYETQYTETQIYRKRIIIDKSQSL